MKLADMKSRLGVIQDRLKEIDALEEASEEEVTEGENLIKEYDELKDKIEAREKIKKRTESFEPEPEPTKPDERVEFPEESDFRDFGDYLQAVVRAGMPNDGGYVGGLRTGIIDRRLYKYIDKEERAASGASEGIQSDGGFLVRTDYLDQLIKRMYDTGVLIGKTQNFPLSSNANSLSVPGIDETSRADGSRWGGLRAYWTGESAAFTSSKPKLREVTLKLNKLTALYYATDELIQDAGALGAYVMDTMPQEMAFKLDDEIFAGDGSGKPAGILDANCTIQVSKETNQAADTIVADNIAKMYMRMWNPGKKRAIWLANNDTIPQLMLMTVSSGTGGGPVMISNMHDAPTFTLVGRPLFFIEHARTVGDAGDLMFVDLSQYYTITKGGLKSASSMHLRFNYDEMAFRWVYRFDGQPRWGSALTPYQGTNTISPFIKLQARS